MSWRRIFPVVAMLWGCFHLDAQIYFVKQGATGDGSSWTNASGNLKYIMDKATSGAQIWVAAGQYLPSPNGDRSVSFTLANGVQLYGGFSGNEVSMEERDLAVNATILSGAIGKTGQEDNSFNVLYLYNANSSTRIDGFIIRDGRADGEAFTGGRKESGGGLYIDGAGVGIRSNPVIANCIFENNYAKTGGAVFNNGAGGTCNPQFINCQFIHNTAETDGGGMYNDGHNNGQCNPELINCMFQANYANLGGAIFNQSDRGTCSPEFNHCHFVENEAYVRGGSVYNTESSKRNFSLLKHCYFRDNRAPEGKNFFNLQSESGEPVTTGSMLRS